VRTRFAPAGGLVALQLLSCGGGGGKTPDASPCPPDADCHVPAFTTVKFQFDHYPEVGFAMDTCTDFAVGKVHVDVTDMGGNVRSAEDDCGGAQVVFQDLPAGMYTVKATPLDFGGVALVNAPGTGSVMAGTPGMNTETTVYVPWDAWLGTYTGTFLFRIAWQGMSCAVDSTPIAKQLLKLTIRGSVVTTVTDTGQKLDGTDERPCRPLDEAFPQSSKMVPFGPGTLEVIGKDSAGQVAWRHEFPVFSGAGISNPTVTYTAPPDAGVDAPVDVAPDAAPDAAADAPPD
jgi:hypothetical protein